MIAVLGTGLLGSGFVHALRRRGERVHVWNRTAARAQALAAVGATPFSDPAPAIVGVSRIHLVLSDDAAVDAVLAAADVPAGATIYDHSTTSTAGVRTRTAHWHQRGVTYLHAPVFMGPGNAREGTGLMLVSGDRDVVAAATPVLTPMTGKLVDVGPRVDAAAGYKLIGNLLLMSITAGFADMLGLAKAMGLAPTDVAALLASFNPGQTLPARLARMLDAPWSDPSWELAMARKDARLMQQEADLGGIALALLPAIAARMDAVIDQGYGGCDWTVLARDHLT